jgi:hypothetical protein
MVLRIEKEIPMYFRESGILNGNKSVSVALSSLMRALTIHALETRKNGRNSVDRLSSSSWMNDKMIDRISIERRVTGFALDAVSMC